jgi:hypothetical protein
MHSSYSSVFEDYLLNAQSLHEIRLAAVLAVTVADTTLCNENSVY